MVDGIENHQVVKKNKDGCITSIPLPSEIISDHNQLFHDSSNLNSLLFPTYRQNPARLSTGLSASTIYSERYVGEVVFIFFLSHLISGLSSLLFFWHVPSPSCNPAYYIPSHLVKVRQLNCAPNIIPQWNISKYCRTQRNQKNQMQKQVLNINLVQTIILCS